MNCKFRDIKMLKTLGMMKLWVSIERSHNAMGYLCGLIQLCFCSSSLFILPHFPFTLSTFNTAFFLWPQSQVVEKKGVVCVGKKWDNSFTPSSPAFPPTCIPTKNNALVLRWPLSGRHLDECMESQDVLYPIPVARMPLAKGYICRKE